MVGQQWGKCGEADETQKTQRGMARHSIKGANEAVLSQLIPAQLRSTTAPLKAASTATCPPTPLTGPTGHDSGRRFLQLDGVGDSGQQRQLPGECRRAAAAEVGRRSRGAGGQGAGGQGGRGAA